MDGMIHWAPEGGTAKCGSIGVSTSASMSRPNCSLCRSMISRQIDSIKPSFLISAQTAKPPFTKQNA